MSKTVAERLPSNQPFNINGIKNRYKRNAWWQVPPYHRNGKQAKKENE
jgi:hypothetical protein